MRTTFFAEKNRIRYDNNKTAQRQRQKLAKGKTLLTELYERRRAGRGGRDRGGVRDGEGEKEEREKDSDDGIGGGQRPAEVERDRGGIRER